MQPTLTTPRLLLRPARPSDLDALWALWTDAEVRRFLWDDRAITRDEAAATLADCVALGARGLGLWLLAPRAADSAPAESELLGCAGLLPVTTAAEYEPRLAGLVEPLVALAPAAWGGGYAHEALTALQAYAAGPLGMVRLAGVTDIPNEASDRMLRRAGFVVLGESAGPRYPLRTYLWEAPPAGGAEPGERDAPAALGVRDVEFLLEELCVKAGFCLPWAARRSLRDRPPRDPDAFADAVFRAEGLDPSTADRGVYRAVRAMVASAMRRAAEREA